MRSIALWGVCIVFCLSLLGVSLVGVVVESDSFLKRMMTTYSRDEECAHPDNPRPYSQREIGNLAPNMKTFHPRLLVFNGTMFEVYNLNHKNTNYMASPFCGRCAEIIPLLVHALIELDPSRFLPGQPVFQLLFSDGDSFESDCVNHGKCKIGEFAPLLLFGSAPMNPNDLPNVKGFPHWFYLTCLYNYKIHGVNRCDWTEPIDRTIAWDELENEIMWRGTDFSFLSTYKQFRFKGARSIHLTNATNRLENAMILMDRWNDLDPRWRAVAMSALSEVENETWIDAKFTGNFGIHVHHNLSAHGVAVRTSEKTTPAEMSKYKYQIDLGGGGGTTWRGTISKLGMPGVLLHHETPTKDWFFDDMKHWEHYIPVHWSLVDLREKFDWAQQNQAEAHRIAEAGSKLYDEFMDEPYMARVYSDLFVDYLGKIVDAYVPSALPWSQAMWEYRNRGFVLDRVAACDDYDCHTFTESSPNTRPHHFQAREIAAATLVDTSSNQ